MSKFLQGTFTPTHPEKYIGNVNKIIFRSSWERKAMIFFDTQPNILNWSSEELIIPYISPIDNISHRYFPDFLIKIKTKDDKINTILVEVKPNCQTQAPTHKKKTNRMLHEVKTFAVNSAKWNAAISYCKRHGMTFQIVDEYDLGIKSR